MLERELGIKIFERAGKRLVLTPKGEALYQDAQKILDLVRDAVERTIADVGEFSGKISLIAPACLRNFYLPAIARFRSVSVERLFAHPEAKLIFRRSKKLSAGEKKLVEFLQAVS